MPDHDVVAPVRRTLADDNILGIHLPGSAVLGGLRERRLLTSELMKVSGCAHRPVELIVVVQDEVRPWRHPPNCGFLYGEWLRADYERGVVPGPQPPGPCPTSRRC